MRRLLPVGGILYWEGPRLRQETRRQDGASVRYRSQPRLRQQRVDRGGARAPGEDPGGLAHLSSHWLLSAVGVRPGPSLFR